MIRNLPYHFVERCRERAPHIRDPENVALEIIQAVQGQSHSLKVAEVAVPSYSGDSEAVWRFGTEDGFVYAVVSERGWPITVLTKTMVSKKKWARKNRRTLRPGTRNPQGEAA